MLLVENGRRSPRLGIVASRKLGDAVARNRAKRLIREIFRVNVQPDGPGVDLVVIPRRDLLTASFASLTQDFRQVWRRASRVIAHAGG
jgi:ribonuclease P protein component